MNFLAPLFLAGIAAVALPVIFHLIRRKTSEQTPFSSLLFLRVSPPRLTKRSRLEDLLLLFLRCVALALIAAAFARPFLRRPVDPAVGTQGARKWILLVDTSASMRRAGLWDAARERVKKVLDTTQAGDAVAVYTFDRRITPVVSFEQWRAQPAGDRVGFVRGRLASVSPGWASTDLGTALVRAAEEIADPGSGGQANTGPLQVILIGDLQEGAHLQALSTYEWPKSVKLVVESVAAKSAGNAGIQWVGGAAESAGDPGAGVRVRVSNSADARREQFEVVWVRPGTDEILSSPIPAYVPPGQSRVVSLSVTNSTGEPRTVLLRGDDESFDNRVAVLPPEPARIEILYQGSDDGTDARQPLFFLRRALEGNPRQRVHFTVRHPDAAVAPAEDAVADLIFVTTPLTDRRTAALREQMTAGRTVVLVPPAGDTSGTLAGLSGQAGMTFEESVIKRDALLGEIDFRHPFFLPFADPRFSDFTRIHFWKYRKIDAGRLPNARVPARFDSGDPAVLELPVGRGRLVILTSGWQPSDSQLAVSSKFIPLIQSLLESTGVGAAPPAQFFVGDPVSLEADSNGGRVVRTPGGRMVTVEKGATTFAETWEPGVYSVEATEAPGRVVRRFAVNVDPQESRTVPMPAETLERFGAPLATAPLAANPPPDRAALLAGAEAEAHQKLWKWVLAGALGFLLLETALAAATGQRSAASMEVQPEGMA